MSDPLSIRIAAARPADADRGLIRLAPEDFAALQARPGDLIAIEGPERRTVARAYPARPEARSAGEAALDETQRGNAGVGLGEAATLRRIDGGPAEAARFEVERAPKPLDANLRRRLHAALEDAPVAPGDAVRVRLVGGAVVALRAAELSPDAPSVVTAATAVRFAEPDHAARTGAYEKIGGLAHQIAAVREMIELPIARPDLFERLGLAPPRGVLFTGPPGSGKTLLARAVADEAGLAFFQVDGPEIMSKHYGDSEEKLRKLFAQAEARAPAIIFIDEIDAIAPKRDAIAADRQLERRVVAQLLTLMDGLAARAGVVVMAATNLPDALDPALRRPGRFDREIDFPPPDRAGRAEILGAHLADAPLAGDVSIDALAAASHGFVGADLAALAREAGMAALRRLRAAGPLPVDPGALTLTGADFEAALRRVGPSITRDVEIETPEVRWSDVGGAETAKAALIESVIWPLRHEAAFARLGLEPAKGVLLAGPPGTGKTHLARALAHEAGVSFIAVRGAQLLSRYVGDSERAVRELFQKARLSAPSILFFDEIDAVAPARGASEAGVASRVVAQLLAEIDGVEELRGVFLLGATNRPDAVDPALRRPGRFDLTLEIGPPDAATRAEILAIHTRGAPLAGDVDLPFLADAAKGMVGADLRAVAQEAARGALRRALCAAQDDAALGEVEITQTDFLAALNAFSHRSVGPALPFPFAETGAAAP